MKDTGLIFNHPNFKRVEENIWVINNFLLESERQSYVEAAESADENEWWSQNTGWYDGKFLSIVNKPVFDVSLVVEERFANLFKNKDKYTFGNPSSIHRIFPDQDMFVHADFPELDNMNKDCVLFNAAIYHNEFDGGELFYPEIGVEYKPLPGDLVIHPGTTKYRHGVKKVLGNKIRYMSNTWVADELGLSIKVTGY